MYIHEHEHLHSANEQQRFNGKIKFLDTPERRNACPPEELLNMLSIKRTDHILDLGAGTGYFSIPAARMTDGTVYALDTDPKILALLSSKAQSEALVNIQLVNDSIDHIPLPNDSIDIVLASLVLHEVADLSDALQQITRVLKDGGLLFCLEYERTESAAGGPPLHIRIPSSDMEHELTQAGFVIMQKVYLEEALYVITAAWKIDHNMGRI